MGVEPGREECPVAIQSQRSNPLGFRYRGPHNQYITTTKLPICSGYHAKLFTRDVQQVKKHNNPLPTQMIPVGHFLGPGSRPITAEDATARIDLTLDNKAKQQVDQNRKVLHSIIRRSIEFCGRQGIALQDHRYEDTIVTIKEETLRHC